MTDTIPFADYARPDRHDREDAGYGDPCLLCGRTVNVGPATRFAHLVDGGTSLIAAGPEHDSGDGDLGWFPVGPECVRRLPTGYAIRLETWKVAR